MKHYGRLRRAGRLPNTRVVPSDEHGRVGPDGYVFVNCEGRRVPVHRRVMAVKLGRPLRPGENVHHIDGDRTNNAPDNLEVWIVQQPAGQRVRDLVRLAILRDEHVEYAEGECPFA